MPEDNDLAWQARVLIQRLSPDELEAFLRFAEGSAPPVIAAELGLPVDYVREAAHRARRLTSVGPGRLAALAAVVRRDLGPTAAAGPGRTRGLPPAQPAQAARPARGDAPESPGRPGYLDEDDDVREVFRDAERARQFGARPRQRGGPRDETPAARPAPQLGAPARRARSADDDDAPSEGQRRAASYLTEDGDRRDSPEPLSHQPVIDDDTPSAPPAPPPASPAPPPRRSPPASAPPASPAPPAPPPRRSPPASTPPTSAPAAPSAAPTTSAPWPAREAPVSAARPAVPAPAPADDEDEPPTGSLPVLREPAGPRTGRFLAADLPERAPAFSRISLLVRIMLARPGTPAAALRPMSVPAGGTRVSLSVSAPGLSAISQLDRDVTVLPDRDSDPVRFPFLTGPPGLHHVTVRAFAGGTFLGELTVQVSVGQSAAAEQGPTRTAPIGPPAAEPGEVTLQVSRAGDLYNFQLISETWYPVQTERLAGDPSRAVEAIAAELRDLAAGQSAFRSPRLIRDRLRNLGAQLWTDAVPEAVRRQFWAESDRIRSFTIASDLDTVPWELLYPVDGSNENGFLCEQFPVVRRVYGQGRAPALPLARAAYVVPRGSPADAMAEVSRVRGRLGRGVEDLGVLDSLEGVSAMLGEARAGVVHFACHNAFTADQGSVVRMADGPFRPSDLSLAVARRSLAGASPLVFFNACRSAGEITGLTQTMGWARQFMSAGSGAFVGSLWPVRSASAAAFADAFYGALAQDGLSLGEASLRARGAIADEPGDPTWLAYTVYGNPAATARTAG